MPFEVIETRRSGKVRAPASMSLRRLKGRGLPLCHIGLCRPVAESINLKRGERVQVQLGTAEHAGLLRLKRDPKGTAGVRPLGTGAFILNLGHLPQFGEREIERQPCEARAVDGDTLELKIPDWSSIPDQDGDVDDDDDEEKGVTEEIAPPVTARPPVQRPATNAAPKNGGAPKLERLGISLDLRAGEEAISFGKKTIDVTKRQAALLSLLLRASPSMIGRDFIGKNALADVASHMRDASLDMIASELKKALPGIGLDLKIIKGAGLALVGAA